jgi:arabinan endo-1,5-alpha-L-arabinosidase
MSVIPVSPSAAAPDFQPVWSSYLADPMVLRVETPQGPRFYAYGTGSSVGDESLNSPDGQTRHFPVLSSTDLRDWKLEGGALIPAPGCENAPHWAPEVAQRDGKFYLFYSCECPEVVGYVNQRLRLAVADHPAGPFHDQGFLLFPELGFTIDASPFHDPQTGEWYLFFCRDGLDDARPGTGTAVVRLDEAMRPTGEILPAILPGHDWHISGRSRPLYERHFELWHTVEGAFCVYRQNQYVCFYSGGAWTNESYGVSYALASNPLGPWRDMGLEKGPSVLRSGQRGLRGPGHNSLVVGPDGRDYLVFHAWNKEATHRQMHVAPLEWDADGPHLAS